MNCKSITYNKPTIPKGKGEKKGKKQQRKREEWGKLNREKSGRKKDNGLPYCFRWQSSRSPLAIFSRQKSNARHRTQRYGYRRMTKPLNTISPITEILQDACNPITEYLVVLLQASCRTATNAL